MAFGLETKPAYVGLIFGLILAGAIVGAIDYLLIVLI